MSLREQGTRVEDAKPDAERCERAEQDALTEVKSDTPQEVDTRRQEVRDEDAKFDAESKGNMGPDTRDITGRSVLQEGDL